MTYQYTCDSCEKYTSERSHGINERPEYNCPICGAILRKVFTPPSLGSKAIPTRKLPA